MTSPNDRVRGLSLEAQVARLTACVSVLEDTNKSLLDTIKEDDAKMRLIVNDIKALKQNEVSLKADLKASREINLKEKQKLQSEISNLQCRMREQYENHQDLEMKWKTEKEKLESQKINLAREFDAANKRVVSSKGRVLALSRKLQVLEAEISETKREFMSRIESTEEKFHSLNETYEISLDDFEALMERLARVENIADQGVIEQMNATIKSLERKLLEQQRFNVNLDERTKILLELQKENESLEGHVLLLEDLLKTMIG